MATQPTTCPDDVKNALLDITRDALLRIRSSDDLSTCQLEADHAHNLPYLVESFSIPCLRYYYEVERPIFIERGANTQTFERSWQTISHYLDEIVGSKNQQS